MDLTISPCKSRQQHIHEPLVNKDNIASKMHLNPCRFCMTITNASARMGINNRSYMLAVMKFSALGDIARILPFLRAMKEQPCIITSPVGKAFLEDEFDDFIVLKDKSAWSHIRLIREIRKRKFSVLIDLQGNDRCRFIDYFSGTTVDKEYKHIDKSNCSSRVREIYKEASRITVCRNKTAAEYIVFNIGSSAKWAAKRPPAEKWQEFAEIVNARFGLPIKLTGSADEVEYVNSIAADLPGDIEVVAGQTNLIELKALLADAFLVVSTDSAALHIAAVQGTPTIGIFGSTTWKGKLPYDWAKGLYDHTYYPDGNMPTCIEQIDNYYDQIDIQEGLSALGVYL